MKRIDGAGATVDHHWTEGDPNTATPATTVTGDFQNILQEEVAGFIEYAGLSLDQSHSYAGSPPHDTTQLRKAVQALIRSAAARYNVKDVAYGAVGDGSTDDTTAIAAAITAATSAGGVVSFPPGHYLISSALVVPDNVILQGAGKNCSILKAGANSMTLVHHVGSYGGASDLGFDNNSHTGVSALRVTPLSETQTTTLVNQNYNTFRSLFMAGCAEAIVMQCGPKVTGTDSGCWYNNFFDIHTYNCIRSLWMKAPANTASAVNRNKFYSFRITGISQTNCGVYIDSATETEFFGLSVEGVAFGSTPCASPTGVYITNTNANSGDNNSNRFHSGESEGCTVSMMNANALTELYGSNFSTGSVWTAIPVVCIGGDGSSVMPYSLPFAFFQGNSQVGGYNNNEMYLPFGRVHFPATQAPSTDPNTLDDYEEGTWTPTLSCAGSAGYTYALQYATYVKMGKTVFFTCHVQLSGIGTAGTNYLVINGLPFNSESTSNSSSAFPVLAFGLTGMVAGEFTAAQIANGQSTIALMRMNQNGDASGTGLHGTYLTTATEIIVSGHYRAAA